MLVDDKMLELIKNDPHKGVCELRIKIEEYISAGTNWGQDDYDALLEGYALITELESAGIISFKHIITELTGDFSLDLRIMSETLAEVGKECKAIVDKNSLERLRGRFRLELGTEFSYEFSQGDLERVQKLINEIRDHISTASLEVDHKQRLLARLEKLQGELHKKSSDLDRFWGLIGDAGVVLGKLGEDAKPIVERIREVAGIVWKTQARSEELTSGTDIPLLGDSSE